jgi:hypothetical protein
VRSVQTLARRSGFGIRWKLPNSAGRPFRWNGQIQQNLNSKITPKIFVIAGYNSL